MKKFLFLALLCLGLYFGARILLVWDKPNSDSSDRVSITISKGMGLNSIANLLHKKDLIRDPLVFRLYAHKNKVGNRLQAGEYVLTKDLTFREVVEALQHGKGSEQKVTIPEGSTINQIDQILARKNLISRGEFIDCTNTCEFNFHLASMEGYLFPSTYYVNPETFTIKKFIQRLRYQFNQQIDPLQTKIQESGRTLNEIIIVASMIEREANTDGEMATISDVIWKRLDDRMYLGIDATTRYEKNDWRSPLLAADFEKDSPYNTRKRKGLPPTAISNPGLAALKAATSPKPSPYWYYLHDSKGQVHFAKTLEEHNANKRRYIY